MTSTIDRSATPTAPAPGHLGQATAIEQSRAVAEVHAAIVVAQQCPRSIQAALAAMRESCKQTGLAERAFYRYPRAGGAVTGPSVHLARELARCWGNIQYGVAELRRDDQHGESEMQAFAWDVQTNTRSAQIFIVPHKRDKRGGPEQLVDLRDIYENNANNGARRLRQAIFSVLPPWFVEEAKDLCSQTLTDGGGKPLPQRIADAVAVFGQMGIAVDQLEQKLGRGSGAWTEHDVAQLGVTYKSLQRGEVTRDEEFPPQRVTAAEIAAAAQSAPSGPLAESRPADIHVGGPPVDGGPSGMPDGQRRRMFALFGAKGFGNDRERQLKFISDVLGEPVKSRSDLTGRMAGEVIDALEGMPDVGTES